VELQDVSESLFVYAAWNGTPPPVPITAPDPRLASAGYRLLSAELLEETASEAAYDAHRLVLGLPDGPPDLEPDRTLLLEAGFDELNGVAWNKGCYMGQELTARTKYRGLVKRRLVPVTLDSAPPAPGTPVTAEGTEVGTLRSSAGQLALAMLRIDALGKHLIAGNALVTPNLPAWMRLEKQGG
jgi:folate-binding protein YgfZ